MGTLSRGYSFGATETVTNAKLHSLIDDASISAIVNADIAAGADIESSKIAFSLSDYVTIAGDQTITGVKTFSQAPVFSSPIGDGNLAQITTYQKVSGSAIGYLASVNASSGALPLANGGTGQITAQLAINALTGVASAMDEYVLTKDTSTGNAIFKAVGNTYYANTVTISSAPTERTNNTTDYVKIKEIVVGNGTFTISFDLRSGAGGNGAIGRIYKNGTAVGTEQTTTLATNTTYTETIAGWVAGDLAQLYIKKVNAQPAYASSFNIKGSQFQVNTD